MLGVPDDGVVLLFDENDAALITIFLQRWSCCIPQGRSMQTTAPRRGMTPASAAEPQILPIDDSFLNVTEDSERTMHQVGR